MAVAGNVRLEHGVKIFHHDLVNLHRCTIGRETKIRAFFEIRIAPSRSHPTADVRSEEPRVGRAALGETTS